MLYAVQTFAITLFKQYRVGSLNPKVGGTLSVMLINSENGTGDRNSVSWIRLFAFVKGMNQFVLTQTLGK